MTIISQINHVKNITSLNNKHMTVKIIQLSWVQVLQWLVMFVLSLIMTRPSSSLLGVLVQLLLRLSLLLLLLLSSLQQLLLLQLEWRHEPIYSSSFLRRLPSSVSWDLSSFVRWRTTWWLAAQWFHLPGRASSFPRFQGTDDRCAIASRPASVSWHSPEANLDPCRTAVVRSVMLVLVEDCHWDTRF